MNTVKIDSGNVKMIAHRGLSGLERENTYPAFVAASNRSYFGVETDVHKTSDGQFIIIHDETTKRVTLETTDINIEENPYHAVKDLVLPDIDGSFTRNDIKIPLLCDYINICKKYEKTCVLELKNRIEKEYIIKMVDEIKNLGYLENVIFISFSLDNCIDLRSILKDNDIQFLTKSEVTDELINTLVSNNLNLDIYYKCLTKENVDKLHKNNILVNCWTCDDKEDAENLVKMGVDFITSNILE